MNGDHPPRRGPTASAEFLGLGETAARFAERLPCSRQKAEYRIARETTTAEGRLRLIEVATMAVLAATEGAQLDFVASEAVLAPREGDIQVVHLHMSGFDGDGDAARGGGMMTMHEPPPRGIPVVLDADDVERLLDELAPRPASATPAPLTPSYPASSLAPATTAQRSQGRPSTYNWDFYAAQLRRRVYRHGLPEKSSIIVAEVEDLFGRKSTDNQPEWRTIERMVAKWWPGLLNLAADLEELRGPCEITPISNSRQP